MPQQLLKAFGFILIITVCILTLTGSKAIEDKSTAYLNSTLKKASISFAGARAVNALVSVAQEIKTGGAVKLLGTGVSGEISPLAWLDPLNDLVERFSMVMLASCISIGIQMFLNQSLPWLSLMVLLPATGCLLLLSLLLKTVGSQSSQLFFRAGAKLLLITLTLTIMIPAMAVVNNATYTLFLSDKYEAASVSLSQDTDDMARSTSNTGLVETVTDMKYKAVKLKIKAENMISHILDLIVVFIIQTIFLPLVMLWLFSRSLTAIVRGRGAIPFESWFTTELEVKAVE